MNTHRQFKDHIYEEFAQVAKAMGNRKRFELLDSLSQGPRTVEVLAREASLPVANASHHLQELKAARLVETKESLFVTYRLADGLLAGVRKVAERNRPKIDRLYHDVFGDGALEGYDKDALMQKIRQGDDVVLDVRPPEEFQTGHVAGALSIPMIELEKGLCDLPKNRQIVVYCRGRYCVLAVQAASKLRDKGFPALSSKNGLAHRAGFPAGVGWQGIPFQRRITTAEGGHLPRLASAQLPR